MPGGKERQRREQDRQRKQQQRKKLSTFDNEQINKYFQDQHIKQQKIEERRKKEALIKRKKRQNNETRLKEAARETAQRRLKRQNPDVRAHEAQRETPSRKRKREDSNVRAQEAQRETPSRKTKRRQNPDVRAHEAQRETPSRKTKRRQNPDVRAHEAQRETPSRKRKRQDPSIRVPEALRDKTARQKARQDPCVRAHETSRETTARKRSREYPGTRDHEAARETPARKKNRQDPSIRVPEALRDKTARRTARQDPSVRAHETSRETTARQKARQDPSVRAHEVLRETTARKRSREYPGTRDHEAARETPARRINRTMKKDFENAIEHFKQEIQIGPIYICTCCHRLLYRQSVVKFQQDQYDNTNNSILLRCRTNKLSNDKIEYICNTCRSSLKRNDLPSLAIANNMELDEIPPQLLHLNSLEVAFIARRISFMKLLALPRGKQRSVHGCVVNIPVDTDECVSLLPRVPSSAGMILVKLKRKLQYRGHVYKENIHPQKILDALNYLILKNGLYADIEVMEDWMEESRENDYNVWSALTESSQNVTNTPADQHFDEKSDLHENNDSETDDQNVDNDSQAEEVNEDERSKLSGLQFNTCIQPKDLCKDNEMILTVAPGEGKKPISFEVDKQVEELTFPQLFPTGRFGFSMQREKQVSMKKYFQARLLNADGRFARNIEYIFAAQYRCEAKEIKDCLSIALRKGKQDNVTAGDLKERMKDFVRNDLGVHFLQKVRGSPAYFNKMLYDLFAMIRQLGPCTWFVTLSAADLKWPDTIKVISDQQGENLTEADIENLSWEQRCQYLRSNPVTAARHFDNRVQLFLKYILLNKKLNPLGEITNYKYRIEFQQRGSPHVHMLVWVRNAPSFESNRVEEIAQFVDRHVTCQLPEKNESLHSLVSSVQKHTHSVACRKHGDSCRFMFPRPPVRETLALTPLDEQPSKGTQEYYSNILQSIHDELLKLDPNDDMVLDDLLKKASVDESAYIAALRWIKTKSGQPAILLQRSPVEVNINNYNEIMMTSWEANLDVQYVTNTYACVMYVASYVCKPEKTLGEVLKAVSLSAQHLGPKSSMKSVAKKFLTHREVSAQEAIYRLLSLPLIQGSKQVVFLPTDLPENRTRLMKPLKVIQALEDDDPDVYIAGILDKYSARPKSLASICFAEFGARYRASSKQPVDADERHNETSDEEIDVDQSTLPKSISLQRDLGNMVLRTNQAVIRYHRWSQHKQPDQYFYSQLLLYLPWREEIVDFPAGLYKEMYLQELETIKSNRDCYEHNVDDLDNAVADLEENGPPEDAWSVLAPQTQQVEAEDERTGTEVLKNVSSAFDSQQRGLVDRDLGLIPHEIEFTNESLSTKEWYCLLLSLNKQQSQVHEFIVDWCTQMVLTHKCKRPDPFHLFLTGGAGVGKSHLVRAIVQTVNRIFSRNNQSNDMHILVCAPTGAAAYNITGYTLHAAFLLPLHKKHSDDYIALSGEKLAALKETIGTVKIIVIDEISMVGADMLLTVHRRLCDVMGNEEPFGGVSVLAVGDLLQLPPVAQRAVFASPSDDMAAIYGSLWTNHFQMVELVEIQRQKNDVPFASMLNRVRDGSFTDEDLEIIKTRQIDSGIIDYPHMVTHIFAYNKSVDDHNLKRLNELQGQKFIFRCKDSTKDDQTGTLKTATVKDMSGGLPNTLTLSVGARVMLTRNIDVQDGLVNSAVGTVTGFHPQPDTSQDPDNFKPDYVFVKFDNENVGKRHRQQLQKVANDGSSTPIPPVESQIRFGHSKVTGKRVQFPLCLAWAVTIHKEQGKTEEHLVVSCSGTFQAGQFYTAISRTKSLSGLYILGEVTPNKIKVNTKALAEIQRMKTTSSFQPLTRHSVDPMITQNLYLKIQCFNVNSLQPHFESMEKDGLFTNCDISCFMETWLKPQDVLPDIPNCTLLRTDNSKSLFRSGGLLMLIHHDLLLIKEESSANDIMEYQLAILTFRRDPSQRICILSVYHNPRITTTEFLPRLEHIIKKLPQGLPSCILGDFNIDMSVDSSSSTNLLRLLRYYGFYKCVSQPTHIKGGQLDNLFVNFPAPEILTDVVPKYYSDHFVVSCAVFLKDFMHQ